MFQNKRLTGIGKYVIFLVVALLIVACLCTIKDRKAEESSSTAAAGYMVDDSDNTIHKTSCKLVRGISSDRRYVLADIETLKEEGYTPCEVCNP